ncbi:ribonuclease J [Mycoplasmoides pirum]|uniref:ribonuclease J n=1 Tax=Mycoplasmoides pirum TaxID=2122 RepID=UPI0006991FE1|nr:ribonuclease J [Mycoplasmoides pirum]
MNNNTNNHRRPNHRFHNKNHNSQHFNNNGKSRINFFALGGQDERGKNCYVLEINDNIFIINFGALIPTTSLLGVKQLIPDFSWLIKNKNRIKGLFIGYPTQDNLGSLEYLLKDIGPIPIYTSVIGKSLIETIAEKKIQNISIKSLKIIVLDNLKPINISGQKVIPFRVSSSMPSSLGFAFHTPNGYVLYIDDFVLSSDKNLAFEGNLNDISSIVGNNVLALAVGIGYVNKNSGFTSPKHKSKEILDQIINNANPDGRIFVSCYDSNAYTILTVAQLAKQKSRPLIIYSHTFINIFSTIVRNKIFNNRNLVTLPISEIDKTNNALICIASNPHRLYSRLSKIANGEDEKIHFNDKDTFVLITPRVAGYEGVEAKILDDIARNDVDYIKLTNDVLPMQASNEDHKYLLNLLKPKYVMPISGLYKDFVNYATIAKHVGFTSEQIKILYNGEVLKFVDGTLQKDISEISLESRYVDSSGIQDIDASILFEREQMAENGVAIVLVFYDQKNHKFKPTIKCELYGISDEEDKLNVIKTKIDEQVNNLFKNLQDVKTNQKEKNISVSEMRDFKLILKKTVTKIFEKNLDKRPIVLPTVIDL